MREWWANVYVKTAEDSFVERVASVGVKNDCPSGLSASSRGAAYAIHVRLKPEGAPRRYASAWQRAMWEQNPDGMRRQIEWAKAAEEASRPYVHD